MAPRKKAAATDAAAAPTTSKRKYVRKTDTNGGASTSKRRKNSKSSATIDITADDGQVPNRKNATTCPADSLPIPRSLEEMTPQDRMLWDERKKGTPFTLIQTQWQELTSQTVGSTTLPNRLTRIKEFIGDFSAEDDLLIMRCKRELEETFEREKMGMVVEMVGGKGGGRMGVGAVGRRVGELEALARLDGVGAEGAGAQIIVEDGGAVGEIDKV